MCWAAHYLYVSGLILSYPLVRETTPGSFYVERLVDEVEAAVFEDGYILLLLDTEDVPDYTELPFPCPVNKLSDLSSINTLLALSAPRRLVRAINSNSTL